METAQQGKSASKYAAFVDTLRNYRFHKTVREKKPPVNDMTYRALIFYLARFLGVPVYLAVILDTFLVESLYSCDHLEIGPDKKYIRPPRSTETSRVASSAYCWSPATNLNLGVFPFWNTWAVQTNVMVFEYERKPGIWRSITYWLDPNHRVRNPEWEMLRWIFGQFVNLRRKLQRFPDAELTRQEKKVAYFPVRTHWVGRTSGCKVSDTFVFKHYLVHLYGSEAASLFPTLIYFQQQEVQPEDLEQRN